MTSLEDKTYIVIVQCHIVKERCSGYFCENAFHERKGGFADYPKERGYRTLFLTCGGCNGRALHRKLTHLARQLKRYEDIEKDRIVVQLSSCVTKDNYHAPPCPHLEYLHTLISRIGLDVREDTRISALSEKRRKEGRYSSRKS